MSQYQARFNEVVKMQGIMQLASSVLPGWMSMKAMYQLRVRRHVSHS